MGQIRGESDKLFNYESDAQPRRTAGRNRVGVSEITEY